MQNLGFDCSPGRGNSQIEYRIGDSNEKTVGCRILMKKGAGMQDQEFQDPLQDPGQTCNKLMIYSLHNGYLQFFSLVKLKLILVACIAAVFLGEEQEEISFHLCVQYGS